MTGKMRRETERGKTGVKQRPEKMIALLKKNYPKAKTALGHDSAFQLLIATILSAQCTDERVNKVVPALFQKYGDAKKLAKARQNEVEKIIRSTGFYKSKAKRIIECSKKISAEFRGRVPEKMDELVKLPGVGRKTANVVLSNWFGKSEGVVVDTHVKRLAFRMGFTKEKSPEKVERDLMKIVPKKEWSGISMALILHGRKTCKARKPECATCFLKGECPRIGVK